MNDIELSILLPAFIAGLLVLATHIPFGMKILERGVIFADLAVAQIAGMGVIFAALLDLTEKPLAVQLIAATSSLCGAALLAWIEKRMDEVRPIQASLTSSMRNMTRWRKFLPVNTAKRSLTPRAISSAASRSTSRWRTIVRSTTSTAPVLTR